MIDESTALGATILARLKDDRVIWMTSVDRGAPQPAPVWFLCERDQEGERIIVYSKTSARRLANIRSDSHVALNFNCTPGGAQVHVIRGTARIALHLPAVPQNQAYMDRYRDWIQDGDDGKAWDNSFEGFAAQYSVPIEITELEIWGW